MSYIESNPLLAYSLKFKPFHQLKLSWEEIDLLQNLKLSNEQLNKVRDIFIFQCFTGLAYADVKKLSSEHLVKGIDNRYWIKMERTKTKRLFSVPMLMPAQKILNKYYRLDDREEGLIFQVLTNQKMNAYLKVISEVAGLKKNLTCHVARHTFATTVTLLEGVPIETVSKLLGHSKISTTQIYSVVTEMKISKDTKELMERLN